MLMRRNAQPLYRLAREVELDEHGGFVSYDITSMTGFDGDELRGFILDHTPIGKLDVDLAVSHEAYVGVHAQIRPDDGFQVGVPIESGRIDHAFYSHVSGVRDIDQNAANLAVLVGFHRGKKWICCTHGWFLQTKKDFTLAGL
jgi:hypothetical protein